MYKHSANTVERIDDWDARYAVNAALDQLVDEAEMSAQTDIGPWQARHSTGVIDRDAELTALAEWFGIE